MAPSAAATTYAPVAAGIYNPAVESCPAGYYKVRGTCYLAYMEAVNYDTAVRKNVNVTLSFLLLAKIFKLIGRKLSRK